MKFKKLTLISLACLSFSLTSCNISGNNRFPEIDDGEIQRPDDEEDNDLEDLYKKAIASGNFKGTYEEWLSFISGESGELAPEKVDPNIALKNAYQKAIDSGNFKGTYEEWLALISGDNGILDIQKDEAKEIYNKYKESHPEYIKTFEEWIDDIYNNNLVSYKSYLVIFDSNGGSEVQNQTIKEGKKIIEPSDPLKAGYTFAGWTYNNKIIDFNSFLVTENIVLVASWTINEYTVNINYGTETPSETRTLNYNSSLTLEDVSKDGFRFLGWFDEDKNEKITFPITIKENLNLVARFSDTIKINFDTNGGNPLDPIEVKIGSTLESLPTPTHNSAVFKNWYILENGEKQDITFPYILKGTSDLKFIADWKLISSDFEYEILNNEIKIIGYIGNDTEIVIPSVLENKPVTILGSDAFKKNKTITSIKMSSIKTIEDEALSACSNLTSVDFGMNVTNYGKNTLLGDKNITSLSFPSNCNIVSMYGNNEVNIPSDINMRLYYNDELENRSLDLGMRKTIIGTFEVLDGFTIMPYFSSIPMRKFIMPNSVTELIDEQFKSCDYLRLIEFSKNIKSIPNSCFSGCSRLEEINIPDSVESIGHNAFYYCAMLWNLKLPNKLKTIGNYAFYRCGPLNQITLPDSVTSIGNYAFYGCSNFKSLNLPSSLTYLGTNFIEDTSITTLYLPQSLKSVQLTSFINNKPVDVYIPKSVTSLNIELDSNGICIFKGNLFYEGNESEWQDLNYNIDENVLKNLNVTYNVVM